jgi:uroporphyrinogen decarboxylase
MMPGMATPIRQSAGRGEKRFLSALKGERTERPPFWLMRQAGRYLPEYRAVRAQAGGFLNMVYDPALAAEVTLQPLRRFGMDAAILFSDILVVPHALGQKLWFAEGEGPRLDPVGKASVLGFDPESFDARAGKVYEAVGEIRARMDAEGFRETALIGFAGAPWTVACYMADGAGGGGFPAARAWMKNDPESFAVLIAVLTEATVHYLERQVAAGAEALQLFDSWAGLLAEDAALFRRWATEPAKIIAARLKKSCPGAGLIGFPREAGAQYEAYAKESGVAALGLDQGVSSAQAQSLQKILPVQGNLEPEILLRGGAALERAAEEILTALSGGPFIFNLGHGVIKETPPDHVTRLAEIVKGWRA